jgi:hypothetical protein
MSYAKTDTYVPATIAIGVADAPVSSGRPDGRAAAFARIVLRSQAASRAAPSGAAECAES